MIKRLACLTTLSLWKAKSPNSTWLSSRWIKFEFYTVVLVNKYEINTVCNLHLGFEFCALTPNKMYLRHINRNRHNHHMPIPKQKPIPKPKIVVSYRVNIYNVNYPNACSPLYCWKFEYTRSNITSIQLFTWIYKKNKLNSIIIKYTYASYIQFKVFI